MGLQWQYIVRVINLSPSSLSLSFPPLSSSSLKERMEHAMSEIVLDLLNPGRSKTNINPEVSLLSRLNTWTCMASASVQGISRAVLHVHHSLPSSSG